MKHFILAAALMCAGTAHALPIITFEGLPDGDSPMNYYAGGQDSLGNTGPNYGVSFSGGTVHYNQYGAYLANPAGMSFASDLAGNWITLLADGYNDDATVWSYVNGQRYVPSLIGSFSFMRGYYYPGMVEPAKIYTGGVADSILFGGIAQAIDNINFNTTILPLFRDNGNTDVNNPKVAWPNEAWPAGWERIYGATNAAAVPEPATRVSLLLGASPMAIVRRRKRRADKH
jgi:hypothetical protein